MPAIVFKPSVAIIVGPYIGKDQVPAFSHADQSVGAPQVKFDASVDPQLSVLGQTVSMLIHCIGLVLERFEDLLGPPGGPCRFGSAFEQAFQELV
jgi:hypothetical protein